MIFCTLLFLQTQKCLNSTSSETLYISSVNGKRALGTEVPCSPAKTWDRMFQSSGPSSFRTRSDSWPNSRHREFSPLFWTTHPAAAICHSYCSAEGERNRRNSRYAFRKQKVVGPPGCDTHNSDLATEYFGSNSDAIDFSKRFEKLNMAVIPHV